MYRYLAAHPNIFMSPVKEPGFFLSDWERCQKSAEDYRALFREARSDHIWIGEATTLYLSSVQALTNIRRFNPEARLIVLLRNPVELVQAFHSEMLTTHCEDKTRFEEAWRLREQRLRGEALPQYIQFERHRALLDYGWIGMLGRQYENLLRLFPRSQIKPIVFEDLLADSKEVVKGVFEWLEIENDFEVKAEIYNTNKRFRFKWLAEFLHRPPRALKAAGRSIKFVIGDRVELLGWLRRVNSVEVQRKPISCEIERELREFFKDDVKLLSELIGRDVTHWLT